MAVTVVYETHATTVDNEQGRATGWLGGALSTAGRGNAEQLGDRRREDGLAHVISSDLARAVETVRIAFAGSAVPIRLDPRLRECDYGVLNGAPVDQVHAVRAERIHEPFPGGQSYSDVVAGVKDLLAELVHDHEGERILLVGHAATRFALDLLIEGTSLQQSMARPFAWQPGWTYIVGG